jgi:hypothetical protein
MIVKGVRGPNRVIADARETDHAAMCARRRLARNITPSNSLHMHMARSPQLSMGMLPELPRSMRLGSQLVLEVQCMGRREYRAFIFLAGCPSGCCLEALILIHLHMRSCVGVL